MPTTDGRRPVAAPPTALLALELPRAAAELAYAQMAGLFLRRMARGDGHPVLVLPGFGASDRSTGPLRGLLRQLGYPAEGWGLGINIGPTSAVVRELPARLDAIVQRAGRPASIVGWSLGGVYARRVAQYSPGSVRQVITLASPFRMQPSDRSNAEQLWRALRHFHYRGPDADRYGEDGDVEVPVPTTAIYTRTDGIVRWYTCIDVVRPRHENVEVHGSHCGLGHNAAAQYVIADRLSQPAGAWQPFRPPAVLRPFYPEPISWEPRRRVRMASPA